MAKQLKEVLSMCKVVLLCDDSGSMANIISEEGTDPFAPKKSTRWLELKKLAADIIEFVTATNNDGLEIYFMNRAEILNVKDMFGLQTVFSSDPSGGTPLIGSLDKIYKKYSNTLNSNQSLLIVVITDGELADGDRNDLFDKLQYVTQNGRVLEYMYHLRNVQMGW